MKQCNAFDLAIEHTYQSLLKVVHTTIVDRWVLRRPPFLFLHKLLVEVLGQYGVFTQEQLSITNLVDREDKAAFLVCAFAFVDLVLTISKEISCLLWISPIKVLAGVEVEFTLLFLRQMCEVHSSADQCIKSEASRKILHAGIPHLYTLGVAFRRGMLLLQALARGFIHRRRLSQSALFLSKSSLIEASDTPQISTFTNKVLDDTSKLSADVVGSKFWFESTDGKIEAGTIVDLDDGMYELVYNEFPRRMERVDSSRMHAVMEASACLNDLMHQEEIGFSLGGDVSVIRPQSHTSKKISVFRDSVRPTTEASYQNEIHPVRDKGQSVYKRRTRLKPSRCDDQLLHEQPGNTTGQGIEDKIRTLDKRLPPSSSRLSRNSRSLCKITPKTSDITKAQLPDQNDVAKIGIKAASVVHQKAYSEKTITKRKLLVACDGRRRNGLLGVDAIGQSKERQKHDEINLFNEVARHIDTFMKQRQLQIADFFRLFDTDNSSSISPQELVNALAQMDLYLTAEQSQAFCAYVDHDGNGEIDVEELGEILRIAKRENSQPEQAQKDEIHCRGSMYLEAGSQLFKKTKSSLPFVSLHKHRKRIYETFTALDKDDMGIVDATELYVALVQLELPDCRESMIHELVQWSLAMPMLMYSNASVEQSRGCGKDRKLHIRQLIHVLEDGMKSKRSNPFLDMIWLNQFDAQLERGYREMELL